MMKFAGNKTVTTIIKLVQVALGGKQNLLTGTQDQVVGFNDSGVAVPINRDVLKGDKGDPGGIYYPTLAINPQTGTLDMKLPGEYSGAVFSISEGKLQMVME